MKFTEKNSLQPHYISFFKKKKPMWTLHITGNNIKFWYTPGFLLNKMGYIKKNFKRNELSFKYLRIFFFKKIVKNYNYWLMFKPFNKTVFKLIFYATKAYYFKWPTRIIYCNNINYFIQYKARIKKKLTKLLYKKTITNEVI